jgi:TIR domain
MAKVFISYSNKNRAYADALAHWLTSFGHEPLYGGTLLSPGAAISKVLDEAMDEADAIVVLISQESQESAWVLAEIGRARALASDGAKLLLPVIIDNGHAPEILRQWLIIQGQGRPIKEVASDIAASLSNFEVKRQHRETRLREVEKDLSKFVEEAIETQKIEGRNNRFAANLCYSGGAVALIVGLVLTIEALLRAMDPETLVDPARMIAAGIANIVAIGFLGALAKYGYMLGKSFMSEALKSADRIHAIHFGQFYLKAYGSRLTPAEVREAFANWNIDRGSTFSTLSGAEIDPQIISVAGQLVSAVIGKKEDK